MPSIQDVVFVLEKHPFKGLKLSLQHNNKLVSPYSTMAPVEVRPLLRQGLLHQDVSAGFEDLLLEFGSQMSIFFKKQRQLTPCRWDEQRVLKRTWCMRLTDKQVSWDFNVNVLENAMLSERFCVVDGGVLARIENDGDAPGSPLETPYQPWTTMLNKAFKLGTADRADFMSFPVLLKQGGSIKEWSFSVDGAAVEAKRVQAALSWQVHYDENNDWVRITALYELSADMKQAVQANWFRHIVDELSFLELYPLKKRLLLCRLVLAKCLAIDEARKMQLQKRIQNVIKDADHYAHLMRLLHEHRQDDVTQIQLLQLKWQCLELDAAKHLSAYVALAILFPLSVDPREDHVSLVVEKSHFHACMKRFKHVLHILHMPVEFTDKDVQVIHHDMRVDFQDNEAVNPIVYINNIAYDEDDLIDLRANVWTSISDGNIQVLDPALVEKCNAILAVMSSQKKTKTSNSEPKQQRLLHMLDWIQLKHAGVHVHLKPDQEKLVQSFLGFKHLEPVAISKMITEKAHDYQQAALTWLVFLYNHQLGAVLADDMGLGKTFQAILLLGYVNDLKQQATSEPLPMSLVVIPPTLMANWEYECKRFCPNLRVLSYVGTQRKLDESYDVVIASYDIVRRDSEILSAYTFNVVIFDEAQLIKNHLSARHQAASKLKRNFTLCLTGTPLENHVGEYVSLLNLVLPGFYPAQQSRSEQVSTQQVQHIVRRSKPFVLRRLKEDVVHELKPKVEEVVFLSMSERQKTFYQTLLASAKKQWEECKKNKGNHHLILTAIMRLRQACISPYLVDETFEEEAPKFTWLTDKINVLRDEGHSVLVFSQFMKSLDLLEATCSKEKIDYLRLDGSCSQAKRKRMIHDFQHNSNPQVFLISLKAGGLGLNLTKASYVFHIDPWWNPAVENQATDRAHRIGQTQTVFSYKLVMDESIEQKIQAIKEKKSHLFKLIFDQSSISQRQQVLSQDDIEALFN